MFYPQYMTQFLLKPAWCIILILILILNKYNYYLYLKASNALLILLGLEQPAGVSSPNTVGGRRRPGTEREISDASKKIISNHLRREYKCTRVVTQRYFNLCVLLHKDIGAGVKTLQQIKQKINREIRSEEQTDKITIFTLPFCSAL